MAGAPLLRATGMAIEETVGLAWWNAIRSSRIQARPAWRLATEAGTIVKADAKFIEKHPVWRTPIDVVRGPKPRQVKWVGGAAPVRHAHTSAGAEATIEAGGSKFPWWVVGGGAFAAVGILAYMRHSRVTSDAELSEEETKIITATREALGDGLTILTGNDLKPLTKSFRGKQGKAVCAVEPTSAMDLYKLIQLYKKLGVGYILQGANTALKGQGTPNGEEKPVVIIRTLRMKKMQLLDVPGTDEYKVILVESGLSLIEAERKLAKLGYEPPHKIGSHAFGNTFGASSANGCGGTRVDNADGRAARTALGNMGMVSVSADGIFYNGIFRLGSIPSGEALLRKIDSGDISIEEVDLPDLGQITTFMRSLFNEAEYPICNHRGNLFAGDGGEGSQTIVYQMYVVRKKPTAVQTFVLLIKNSELKSRFYQEAVMSVGPKNPDELPIFCEHMGSSLAYEIVRNGVTFPSAPFLAMAPNSLTKYFTDMLQIRSQLLVLAPSLYVSAESFAGRLLSRIFTPTPIRTSEYAEMITIQVADRTNLPGNIEAFKRRLALFVAKNPGVQVLEFVPGSLKERIVLELRNVAALTTKTLSVQKRGALFAFDDAVMPGDMTNLYCRRLVDKLSARFPGLVLLAYLYGHDLKQINHNDWVLLFENAKRVLSHEETDEIYRIQYETMRECGGIPHAEHGVGDHADTDLSREELVKLVAHRLVNDFEGIANPGGGPERAFQKAIRDPLIVQDAVKFAKEAIQRETKRETLFSYGGLFSTPGVLLLRVEDNARKLTASLADAEKGKICMSTAFSRV